MTFSDDIAAFWDSFLMHRLHKLLNLKRKGVKIDDDDDNNLLLCLCPPDLEKDSSRSRSP